MTTAQPICENEDHDEPAAFDLHREGHGCLYVCAACRDALMSASNWTLYEIGAHTRTATPVSESGWSNKDGGRIELDGTPARERVWRP